MNFRKKLSQRIHKDDINEICFFVQDNNKQKQALFRLIYDSDDTISYQALWVFTNFDFKQNEWLYPKQNELIDYVLICSHSGKRRLLLALLLRQPLSTPIRVDFLNFCIERMVSTGEPPGIQSLCLKLAYELCLHNPDLLQEFSAILEMTDFEVFSPAIQCARKNIVQAMKRRKSIQLI